MITAVNEQRRAVLRVCFTCAQGDSQSLQVVDPEEVPWHEADGVSVRAQDVSSFTRAAEVVAIAPEILRLDPGLNKYIHEPGARISWDDA
jgi:hypothetical protein